MEGSTHDRYINGTKEPASQTCDDEIKKRNRHSNRIDHALKRNGVINNDNLFSMCSFRFILYRYSLSLHIDISNGTIAGHTYITVYCIYSFTGKFAILFVQIICCDDDESSIFFPSPPGEYEYC